MKNANNYSQNYSMGINLRCLQQEAQEKEVCNFGQGKRPKDSMPELDAGLSLTRKAY